MYPSEQAAKLQLRLPADCKEWLRQQAVANSSSQNSEIVRCIRERMQRFSTRSAGSEASTGTRLATDPADAGFSAALAGGTHQP